MVGEEVSQTPGSIVLRRPLALRMLQPERHAVGLPEHGGMGALLCRAPVYVLRLARWPHPALLYQPSPQSGNRNPAQHPIHSQGCSLDLVPTDSCFTLLV